MAIIAEFGSAPKFNGTHRMIGTIKATPEQAVEDFFADDVVLVHGGPFYWSEKCLFAVMIKK